MANPNSEVWGLPETWQYCKYKTVVGNGNAAIKAIKPKIADFGGGDGSLYSGNLHGKTPINTMIDLSICPCGQDPTVSAFGRIGMFYNYQNVDDNKIPNTVIENTSPINWFLYDGHYDWVTVIRDHIRDRQSAADRWSPEMTMINNMNGAINPFVYYQIRSLLAVVVVACITGYESTGIPAITWRTAYDWKTNYNTQKIADIRLQISGYSSNTLTDISYFEVLDSGADTINGIGLMLETSDEYSENIIDYAIINAGRYSMPTLIGMNLAGNWYEGRCFYMCGYDMFAGQTYGSVARTGVTDGGWCVWSEIPYSADNYEKIMQMTACFGMMFTDKAKFTFSLDCNDVDLYIPIIDENGITHGEYTHGAENLNNDLLQLDSIRDKNYDPSLPVDPNTYSDTTTFNNVGFQQAFTRRYLLTSSQVWDLAGELWNANATKDPDETMDNFTLDEYLTNNPIDTIVSLKYFPCTFTDANPTSVYLGKYQTSIIATGLSTSVRIIDFDYINVYEHFGDFRDFEQYTTLSMYIPFCGTVKIPTAEAMGKWVGVKLAIDTATGAATGYVLVSKTNSGGICVATATGTAAIDIPVSGLQSANIQQAIFNAAANWTQTQISNAKVSSGLLTNIGKLTGNETLQTLGRGYGSTINNTIPTTLSGLGTIAMNLDPNKAMLAGKSLDVDTAKSNYELHHIDMPMRLIGSASPVLSTVIELNCRLIIYRPITDESALANYGDTVGFATIKGGTVSQFSGYTEGTIDVSGINATADEKQAIAAAFANGVYL